MSLAHTGTQLNLKGLVPTLPEGMILFPLDGRVEDTTGTIPVSLNTTTLREDEYKFSGSVAVEDGTTNILPSAIRNNTGWNCYDGIDAPTHTWGRHIGYSIIPNGFGSSTSFKLYSIGTFFGMVGAWATDVVTGQSEGTQCAYSLKIKALKPTTFIMHRYSNNATFGIASSETSYTLNPSDGWKLCSHLWTNRAGDSTHVYILINGSSFELEISEPQVEYKNHVTSFVNGTRAVGNLKYDISSLGMKDAGCISCWLYNSDTMVNNRTANNQYILKLGSFKYSDWYDDAQALWIQDTGSRVFKFWSGLTASAGAHNNEHINSLQLVSNYGGVGAWNHFVLQWDKNGLPSGNKKEFYINGILQGGNTTTLLPNNPLTYLLVGSWANPGGLMPNTLYEQLAIHPSKGFSADTIKNWYNAQAPFFDRRDQL